MGEVFHINFKQDIKVITAPARRTKVKAANQTVRVSIRVKDGRQMSAVSHELSVEKKLSTTMNYNSVKESLITR